MFNNLNHDQANFFQRKLKLNSTIQLRLGRLARATKLYNWRKAGRIFGAIATLPNHDSSANFARAFFPTLESLIEEVDKLFRRFKKSDRDSILDGLLSRVSPSMGYLVLFGCAGVTVSVAALGIEFLFAGQFLNSVFTTVFALYLFQESQTVAARVEFEDECSRLVENFERELGLKLKKGRLTYEEYLKSGIWIDNILQQLASKCHIPQQEIEEMSRKAANIWRARFSALI